ncbi:MAG: HTTM domain-containing protein [Myxococcota bacterium]
MSLGARLDAWWRPAWPAERLATLRLIVGTYGVIWLLARLPHLLSYARDDVARFDPVGVLTGFAAPLPPALYGALVVALLPLALAFLAGWRFRITGPAFAGLLLVVLTHTNSWGKILHTENVWWFHVAILAASPAADALSRDARRREPAGPAPRYGWPVMLMMAAGAMVYLLAGVAKLRNSGFDFVMGETLRNYVAFGTVRKIALGSPASPLAAPLLGTPSFFAGLAVLSFVLELAAPLVLFVARLRKPWVMAVWGFHWGVLALMAIGFPYQLSFVAFACYLHAEKVWGWGPLRGLGRRLGVAPGEGHSAVLPSGA